MFVDGVHCLQHVPPVALPVQRVDGLAVAQPGVEIQVTALHQHVDVAAGDLTASEQESCDQQHAETAGTACQSTTHLLVIEFNDLIAVLLKMIQVLDLILVAFHGLSIGLL